jgi:hypothetical protein
MKWTPTGWLLLVSTLPTENATARMRFWRALKALGCGSLRDGVFLLPAAAARRDALSEISDAIVAAGGSALVIDTASRDRAQEDFFRGLFDRAEEYAAFIAALSAARRTLAKLGVAEVNRLLRRLRREYDALQAIDYFKSDASVHAEAAWTDFVGAVDSVLSPDEPHAANRTIKRLKRDNYRGCTWATRRRIWVDRVASAWLIRRFIDPDARFIWLEKPSACPKHALGFDFDGATFSHVGERVTFEVLAASFGLDKDGGIARLGALVRALDVGAGTVAEAAGFEALIGGARQRAGDDDDALLEEMSQALDSMHAFYSMAPRARKP